MKNAQFSFYFEHAEKRINYIQKLLTNDISGAIYGISIVGLVYATSNVPRKH